MAKRSVLGRGINALIPDQPHGTEETTDGKKIIYLDVDQIKPNPFQARTEFNPEHIEELAHSIQEKGVIQPISVNHVGKDYVLIAGERRWRATRKAGIGTIPAIIREVESDQDLMELSLIENIQRENLSPIEEAEGYRTLIDNCFLTQEQVAQKVGKSRSTITNLLRLLNLSGEIQDYLRHGQLQMGHARALLGLQEEKDRIDLAKRAVNEKLSARQIESAVNSNRKEPKRINDDSVSPTGSNREESLLLRAQEEKLQLYFGTGVHIRRKGEKGRIEIDFYNSNDLDRILEILNNEGE
tara:strand:+ start:1448 stop:2341 length:894 start_codon:yes stop_codon:yes gene_type:complete